MKRNIEIFTDAADWASSKIDRRSTTGYCTFVWGNLVTWQSKKQSVVSRSSVEAKLRAPAQRILSELRTTSRKAMEIADMLTKALCKNAFEVLKGKLDLINIYNAA
ncbi:putative mitochondrial protein [Cucumis melo var. makuwa]|uniref:Putative mitochondrial protein n=1 Tax=Cucumis melo var. makuwa TaxID=1194695 RepID=A0A5D3DK75_CUCMM|nr:putative mitochondrial protein [Cucumis melo var. makuwa]